MSFAVHLNPAAAAEVKEAFAWYESRHTGLGAEFLRAIAASSDALARDPERFPISREPFRWIKLRKFPYGLHDRIKNDEVLIVACLHFRQSPKRWPGA